MTFVNAFYEYTCDICCSYIDIDSILFGLLMDWFLFLSWVNYYAVYYAVKLIMKIFWIVNKTCWSPGLKFLT